MRAFIAIDLPQILKEKIAKIEDNLKACGLEAKWVNPKNLHLTLKFLGEVKEEKLEKVKESIETAAKNFIAFKANLKSFGFFPNQERPRVFFISSDNEEKLKKIALDLEEKLEKAGFPREGRFKSHLTLARLKNTSNISCFIKKLEGVTVNETFPIDKIILFKSTLTKDGSIYEKVSTSSLTA